MSLPPLSDVGLDRLEDPIARMVRQLTSGDLGGCARTASEVLNTTQDDDLRARAQGMLGLAFGQIGRLAEARDRLLLATSLAPHDDLRASLTAYLSRAYFRGRDCASAEETALAAIELGERVGNRLAICEGLSTLALVRQTEGDPYAAFELACRAVGLVEVGTRWLRPLPELYAALALIDLDRLAEADRELTAGLGLALREDRGGDATWFCAFRVLCRFTSGDWDGAIMDSASALDLAQRTGTLLPRPLVWGIAAMIEHFRGNGGAARELLAAGGPHRVGAVDGFGAEWLVFAEGLTDPDPRAGFESMREAWRSSRDWPWLVSWRLVAPTLVRAALAFGDRELAESITAEVAEGAALVGSASSATAAVLRCRGLLGGDPELIEAAATAFADLRRPLAAGYASLDAARLWIERGDTERARERLLEASETFHALRATACMATVGRLLARNSAAPPAETRVDWLARLTRGERVVAELAARGLTNPEIAVELQLSSRTVQSHLSHVYVKLRLTSRVQLAALLGRHEP